MTRCRTLAVTCLVGCAATLVALHQGCAPIVTGKSTERPVKNLGGDGPPFDSGALWPFGAGFEQVFTIESPPPAETDVEVGFIVSADLGAADEFVNVFLNGQDLGRLFESDGADCANPAQEASIR